MAIEVSTVSNACGIALPEAYIKIATIGGDAATVTLALDVYADAPAREANKQPIERRHVSVPTGEIVGPLMPVLYAALKALPEYAGAEDC